MRRGPIEKFCLICDMLFFSETARINTAKYCSTKCMGISRIGNKYARGNKGRKFTEEHSRKKSEAQMGSKNPNWKKGSSKLVEFECNVCGNTRKVKKYLSTKMKCCSLKCVGILNALTHSGSNHYNWQGGKSIIHDRIRRSWKYRNWRKKCFERDNYICQTCNESKPNKLQVDHYIFPLSSILNTLRAWVGNDKKVLYESALKFEPLWDINNGKTVCVDCHKLTDTYGKKALSFKYEY